MSAEQIQPVAPVTVAPDGDAVSFRREGGTVHVMIGGRPFTSLVTEKVAKPALHPLRASGGQQVTRGYPLDPRAGEEQDHPHHTSLWFAHGDVNSRDFWTGANGAHIAPTEPPVLETSGGIGSITATFAWLDDKNQTVCTERRVMRFSGDAKTRTIDFDFTLTASNGKATFGDTKEGTFGIRLAETLRLTGPVAKGSILNSAGARDAECWGKRAAWVRYAGPVEGVAVSIAIFDHRENPRHPTWWHARDYGLFAANPFGVHDFEGKPAHTGDLILAAGESIRFRYRLVIEEGTPGAEQLDAAFKAYSASPQTSSGTTNGAR